MTDELPLGWVKCKIETAFHSFSGGTPNKGVPSYWNGPIPWLSSGDIKSDHIKSATYGISQLGLNNSSASICRQGSLVVVVRSGILKHTLPVAVLDFEAAINQDIKCFDSGNDHLNRWLALALRTFARDILALNREGTTVQSVKYETLKSFELPLPPLAEQQRITANLEKLLAKVDKCQEHLTRIFSILKCFRQSVLAAACSGRLTADWREQRDAGTAAAQVDMESEGLPANWREVRVGDVIENLKYGTSQKCDYRKLGVPVLRIPNVANGSIDHGDLKYAKLPPKEQKQLHLEPGDILIVRSNGSVSLVGKCALVTEKERGFAYAGYLIRIRPSRDLVIPEFLNLVLGSYEIRLQIELEARSTSGVNNVNSDELRALRIALAPLAEQQEIVLRVNGLLAQAERMELRCRRAQQYVSRLSQSILAQAFRGELVPTEAELAEREGRSYESAEQLLQRIRTLKDGAKPSGATSKGNGNKKAGKATGRGRRKPLAVKA